MEQVETFPKIGFRFAFNPRSGAWAGVLPPHIAGFSLFYAYNSAMDKTLWIAGAVLAGLILFLLYSNLYASYT
jgi:hypothetical protein